MTGWLDGWKTWKLDSWISGFAAMTGWLENWISAAKQPYLVIAAFFALLTKLSAAKRLIQ